MSGITLFYVRDAMLQSGVTLFYVRVTLFYVRVTMLESGVTLLYVGGHHVVVRGHVVCQGLPCCS